jgi:ribonuclease P protein component
MRRFASLNRQADFARLRRQGRRVTTTSLIIYRGDSLPGDPSSLVGITVSKSIGTAVIRNKLRRRLAAILHCALATHRAMRLLVVARPHAAQVPFGDLSVELTSALGRAAS